MVHRYSQTNVNLDLRHDRRARPAHATRLAHPAKLLESSLFAVAMNKYPTPWQRKIMWAALSSVFVVLLILIAGSAIWVAANLIAFLQPILIPVAIAGILAYLLDPLVTKISRGGLGRTKAVLLIFAVALVAMGGIFTGTADLTVAFMG